MPSGSADDGSKPCHAPRPSLPRSPLRHGSKVCNGHTSRQTLPESSCCWSFCSHSVSVDEGLPGKSDFLRQIVPVLCHASGATVRAENTISAASTDRGRDSAFTGKTSIFFLDPEAFCSEHNSVGPFRDQTGCVLVQAGSVTIVSAGLRVLKRSTFACANKMTAILRLFRRSSKGTEFCASGQSHVCNLCRTRRPLFQWSEHRILCRLHRKSGVPTSPGSR